jgi:hypothetical protein
MSSSSFAAKKLNASTFLVTEDDAYGEHPLIYVKVHPTVPVIVIGDTGCDRASKPKKQGKSFLCSNLSCRALSLYHRGLGGFHRHELFTPLRGLD